MPSTVLPTRRGSWFEALLLTAIVLLAPATAPAQIRLAPAATPDPLSDVLAEGRALESRGRWGEALSHYEEALREHPGQRTLRERANLTEIHYDLARRYGDPSFRRAVATLDAQKAIDLYSEVLLKINAHHVSEPQWQQMVVRGTTCLDVALSDRTFSEQHLRAARPEAIDAFRRELYRVAAARAIRTRHDARQTVVAVAEAAGRHLRLSTAAVVMEFTCGATGGLDNYSAYLTGDQLRDVYSQIEGNFVGLGIELKADDGALRIVQVISSSPAERAGIRSGDLIVAVDGRSTRKLTTDEAASLLTGAEGSYVDVMIVSHGRPERQLRVRREHVEVPSVDQVQIVDRDYGVAYLKLTSFQKTTTRDLDAALWKLHRDGMRSLIIDLRGNPGGLLTTSVEIADKFVEQGTIVSTRGRSPQEDYNYTAHRPGTWRVPLVVLIDGDSASASEIFAGAIRDNRRGHVVGVRSFGKGSVQGIFPLNQAGAGVRLTTAKFYSPSGRAISKVGVQPDIVVRQAARVNPDDPMATAGGAQVDNILDAGVQAARRQLAAR